MIVIVRPGTHVNTTVLKIIVVVTVVTGDYYDCTEIYREGGR